MPFDANRLVSKGLSYAIGIYDAIADDIATKFFGVFYNNIASGISLKSAIEGASAITLREIQGDAKEKKRAPDLHLPRLVSGTSLDPARERFR